MKDIIYILNYYSITYDIKTYNSITYLIRGDLINVHSSFYEYLLYIFTYDKFMFNK